MTAANTDSETVTYTAVFGSAELAGRSGQSGYQALHTETDAGIGLPLILSCAVMAAFKEESRRIFQELGWTFHAGRNGVCDTVTKGHQELYLHPMSFNGVLDESDIDPLLEQLSKAGTSAAAGLKTAAMESGDPVGKLVKCYAITRKTSKDKWPSAGSPHYILS